MSDDTHGYEAQPPARNPFQSAEERLADFQRTFDSVFGQKVLLDLKEFCHQTRASYMPGGPGRDGMTSALESAYYEGRRSVVLHIMRQIAMDDEQLAELARTQAQRAVRN